MLAADQKGLVTPRYRGLSMKFGLPMAVTLLLIQLAAAFCISKTRAPRLSRISIPEARAWLKPSLG